MSRRRRRRQRESFSAGGDPPEPVAVQRSGRRTAPTGTYSGVDRTTAPRFAEHANEAPQGEEAAKAAINRVAQLPDAVEYTREVAVAPPKPKPKRKRKTAAKPKRQSRKTNSE